MKYLFANWKMYLDLDESVRLIESVKNEPYDPKKVSLAVFPNFLAIDRAITLLRETQIAVGAQNVNWMPQGAYTGAISAYLVKRAGCEYAIIGHSERRYIFGETNDDVRKKIEACLAVDLAPVVCVGETKEDLANGKRQYRLKKQLMKAFDNLAMEGKRVLIAYEPVWAISKTGTREPCNPADADDVHGWIREERKKYTSPHVPILYGGSADANNAASYLSRETVVGVLVGSALTKKDSLIALIRAMEQ